MKFDMSDLISSIAIVVDVLLTIGIVVLIGKKQSDKRVLKDVFISDLKEFRTEYIAFLSMIDKDKIEGRLIIKEIKDFIVTVQNLEDAIIENKYITESRRLLSRQINNFRESIDEDSSFIENFKVDNVNYSMGIKRVVLSHQKKINKLYFRLIKKINEC